jgi:hypothetical protein
MQYKTGGAGRRMRSATFFMRADPFPGAERLASSVTRRTLERALGDDDAVAATLRAWAEARESQAHEIARETPVMAVHWPQAYLAGR